MTAEEASPYSLQLYRKNVMGWLVVIFSIGSSFSQASQLHVFVSSGLPVLDKHAILPQLHLEQNTLPMPAKNIYLMNKKSMLLARQLLLHVSKVNMCSSNLQSVYIRTCTHTNSHSPVPCMRFSPTQPASHANR